MFPCLEINLRNIQENARKVVHFCRKRGIETVGVTKGVCADLNIVKAMLEGGIEVLGDSRIQNIIKLKEAYPSTEVMLIRSPMLSEVEKVVEYTDYSLNTELAVVKKISETCEKLGRTHKVIVMVDVGDRREGLLPNEVILFIQKLLNLRRVEIVGIGSQLGCFGGVLPTFENQRILVDLAERIKKELHIDVPIISVGGSVILKLLEGGNLPGGINQIRSGEAILLGTSTTDSRIIPWLRQDTFTLKAEIIELKEKPSLPKGPIGKNAFGHTPQFTDRGIRKRAILAIGGQDVSIEGLIPLTDGIEILGGSSDHIIVDVTDSQAKLEVGDILEFRVNYEAMLRAMTSKYVNKKYVKIRLRDTPTEGGGTK